MNNLEDLRFDPNEENTEKRSSEVLSIIEPVEVLSEVKKKKTTIFTAFKYTFRRDKSLSKNIPNFTGTVTAFLIFFAVFCCLVAINTFGEKILVLPLFLMLAGFAVPITVIIFYVEYNLNGNNSLSRICICFATGIVLYFLTDYFCNSVLAGIIFNFSVFVYPVIWLFATVGLVSLYCNLYKVVSLGDCLLIAVSVAMGFSCAESLATGFENLFVSQELPINETSPLSSELVQILVNDNKMLETSLSQLGGNAIFTFIINPFLYSVWAVLIAAVISTREEAFLSKTEMPKSMYLLIVVILILFGISKVDTSFSAFNYILKAVSTVISALLLINVLNIGMNSEEKGSS